MTINQDQSELEFQDFDIESDDVTYNEETDDIWRFFCVVFARDQKPLLESPALAEKIVGLLQDSTVAYNAQLWGYVILPDSVQFVVEVESEKDYHTCVEAFKVLSEKVLVEAIKAEHEYLIDHITFYNPAWTEPSYLIWQAGYQTQLLSSLYALSNKIADLVTKPVNLGLVEKPVDWAFSSYRANID
jgi:REP element-mobilizing transposase RayT